MDNRATMSAYVWTSDEITQTAATEAKRVTVLFCRDGVVRRLKTRVAGLAQIGDSPPSLSSSVDGTNVMRFGHLDVWF